MREIKFKGKRKDNGEWVYGCLIELWTAKGQMQRYAIDTCSEYKYNEESLDVFEVDPETVGEFTGLKDKNGKEIYEGDRIRQTCNMRNHGGAGIKTNIYVVEWFGIEILPFSETGTYMEEFEVIGNIYDNPDLKEANDE